MRVEEARARLVEALEALEKAKREFEKADEELQRAEYGELSRWSPEEEEFLQRTGFEGIRDNKAFYKAESGFRYRLTREKSRKVWVLFPHKTAFLYNCLETAVENVPLEEAHWLQRAMENAKKGLKDRTHGL